MSQWEFTSWACYLCDGWEGEWVATRTDVWKWGWYVRVVCMNEWMNEWDRCWRNSRVSISALKQVLIGEVFFCDESIVAWYHCTGVSFIRTLPHYHCCLCISLLICSSVSLALFLFFSSSGWANQKIRIVAAPHWRPVSRWPCWSDRSILQAESGKRADIPRPCTG